MEDFLKSFTNFADNLHRMIEDVLTNVFPKEIQEKATPEQKVIMNQFIIKMKESIKSGNTKELEVIQAQVNEMIKSMKQ